MGQDAHPRQRQAVGHRAVPGGVSRGRVPGHPGVLADHPRGQRQDDPRRGPWRSTTSSTASRRACRSRPRVAIRPRSCSSRRTGSSSAATWPASRPSRAIGASAIDATFSRASRSSPPTTGRVMASSPPSRSSTSSTATATSGCTGRGAASSRSASGQIVAISTAGEPGSEFELTRERIRQSGDRRESQGLVPAGRLAPSRPPRVGGARGRRRRGHRGRQVGQPPQGHHRRRRLRRSSRRRR